MLTHFWMGAYALGWIGHVELVNERAGMAVEVLPVDVYGRGVAPRLDRNPPPLRHRWV